MEQGRYIALDVAEALSTFMIDGMPDPARFMNVSGDLIVEAAQAVKGEYARVAACGEGVHLLWEQGKAEAAIRLERLTNQIAKSYEVDVLCGYVMKSFQREPEGQIYERICAEHSAVCSQWTGY